MHLQLCDKRLICFYLFKASIAKYEQTHDIKQYTALVAIHAKHSNFEIALFWKLPCRLCTKLGRSDKPPVGMRLL